MREWQCSKCKFLNKNRKKSNLTEHFRYGCDARKDRYVCGWIKKDSELKTQGCSDCNILKFGDVFVIMKQPYYSIMYLGKVHGKRLLYNQDVNKYKLVKDNYFNNKVINLQCRFGHDRMCKERRKAYDSDRN